MQEWSSEALILGLRPQGESSAVIDLLFRDQGRRSALLRGAGSRKLSAIVQPGNLVQAQWRARIDGQLGAVKIEPIRARAGFLLQDPKALAALRAVLSMLARALPEAEPHPVLFDATGTLLDALIEVAEWPALYLHWEMGLLQELGFSLDLTSCAVTGSSQGLAYVSPRTGRAVTRSAAAGWEDRLLPLPSFLRLPGPATPEELREAFRLTGHFLNKGLCIDATSPPLPEARARLARLLTETPPTP